MRIAFVHGKQGKGEEGGTAGGGGKEGCRAGGGRRGGGRRSERDVERGTMTEGGEKEREKD